MRRGGKIYVHQRSESSPTVRHRVLGCRDRRPWRVSPHRVLAPEDAPCTHELTDRVSDAIEALTADIVNLTAVLGKLRGLHTCAVAGDAQAIEEAEAIADELYSPVDYEQSYDLEARAEELEELITSKYRSSVVLRDNVCVEDLETELRDVVLPLVDAGDAVTVHYSYQNTPSWVTTRVRISLERHGKFVNINVSPLNSHNPQFEARKAADFRTGNATIDDLVARVCERDGGASIVAAIFQVAKSNELQLIALLQKAVA